jgi:hypothetical protein
MRFVLALSALSAILGLLTGIIALLLVGFGLMEEVTGAPPGGVLRGFLGGLLAVAFHAVGGAASALLGGLPWIGLFLLLFGFVGVVRRRCKWYVPLLGMVAIPAALVGDSLLKGTLEWLGSVSRWDAAAKYSGTVATIVFVFGSLPLWGVQIWRSCNRGPEVSIGEFYEHPVPDLMPYEQRVEFLSKSYMAEWGQILMYLVSSAVFLALPVIGWTINGLIGALIGLALGAVLGGLLGVFVLVVAGAVVSVAVVMPVATLLAIWTKVPGDAIA